MGEIAKLLGKTEPEKVAIDIGSTLDNITLKGLNADFWPALAAFESDMLTTQLLPNVEMRH